MKATAIGWLVLVLTASAPLGALAQDDEDEEKSGDEASEDEGGGDDEASEGDDEGEGGDDEEGDAKEAEGEGDESKEAPAAESRSWYFGPILRYVILPAFYVKAFLAEGPTLNNASFGIVANHPSADGMGFELGLAYTGVGFEGPMRADGDPPQDTEWVESDLAMLHATASIYWSASIIDKLSFEYGLGLDLGFLLGDVKRTEAYKVNGEWTKCPGVIPFPQTGSDYCAPPRILPTDAFDDDGEHYNVIEERVPAIGGNLMLPHLALRYEPIPELAFKIEGGLGFPMFFLGLSAAYGPEL